jgi:hypothetical protein
MNLLNKKFIFAVLLFAALGALIPSGSAFAVGLGGIADVLVGALTALPMIGITVALSLAALLAGLFAGFAGVILKWVLSPSFVSWSYTNPENNPLIRAGLNITLSFANMILVIFLVVIALSIALGIKEYGSKKTFAKLLIVALLINFAPVVAGVIVDAANIVMNFFIKGITGGERLTNNLKALGESLTSSFLSKTFTVTGQIDRLAEIVMLVFVSLVLTIILIAFAFLFAARYVVIWLLVILAPLAFACSILPGTQRIWKLWWSQFFKWVFSGVSAIFFLYLADQFANVNPSIPPQGTFGSSILPALLPIIVYYAAFSMGLGVINPAETTIRGFTKKYGRVVLAASAGAALRSRLAQKFGLKEKLEKQASAPFILEGIQKKGLIAKGLYGLTFAAPIWAVRRGVGELALRTTEKQSEDMKKVEGEYQGTTAQRKLAAIRDYMKRGMGHKAAAVLRAAKEEGQLGDLGKLGLSDDEIVKIGRSALGVSFEAFKPIRDAYAHLAEKMAEGVAAEIKKKAGLQPLTEEEKDAGMNKISDRILTRIKPDDIPKISEEALLKNFEFFHTKLATVGQVSALLERGPMAARLKFIEVARRNGLSYYEDNAPAIYNYLQSNPGIRALGGPIPHKPAPSPPTQEEEQDEEVRNWIEARRKRIQS